MFVVGKSLIWVCDNCKGVSDACEKCGTPVRQQTIRKDNYKTCSMCFKKDFKVRRLIPYVSVESLHDVDSSYGAVPCEAFGNY
jgi:hypothetical protein